MNRSLCFLRLLAFALAIAFTFVELTDAQGDKTKTSQELVEPFKGNPGTAFKFKFWGKDAQNHVFYEPAGLRITLPAGYPKDRANTGVTTDVAIAGDFEISVRYEVLQEPAPADAGKVGTAFSLILVQKTPHWQAAGLSRKAALDARVADGVCFRTYFQFQNETTNKGDTKGAVFDAHAKSGRLRMARTGPVLSYFAADGANAEFQHLRDFSIGTEDLMALRLVGNTGGPLAALDVRVTDLHVRVGLPPSAPAPVAAQVPAIIEPPATPAGAASKNWLMAALLVGAALIVGVALAGGAFFFLRRRRTAETPTLAKAEETEANPPAVPASFKVPCPSCSKNIKVKVESAGKKVKCPHCGNAVLVPEAKQA